MSHFKCWLPDCGDTETDGMLITIASGWQAPIHAAIEDAAREFIETQEAYAESDADRAVMLGKSTPVVSVRDLATGKQFNVTVSGELIICQILMGPAISEADVKTLVIAGLLQKADADLFLELQKNPF